MTFELRLQDEEGQPGRDMEEEYSRLSSMCEGPEVGVSSAIRVCVEVGVGSHMASVVGWVPGSQLPGASQSSGPSRVGPTQVGGNYAWGNHALLS